jgi:biopolymer transport protein ExbD
MQIPSPIARRRPRIEVVPLIDIVFFLLATFVMVSMSMIKNHGIAVRLPTAVTGAPQDRRAISTVSLAQDGTLYLNQQPTTLEALGAQLRRLQADDERLRVIIHGDERAAFGRAVQALDEIRRAGIPDVSIQTRPASVPEQTP